MHTDAARSACGRGGRAGVHRGRSLLAPALLAVVLAHGTARAADEAAAPKEAARFGGDWRSWHVNTDVTALPSVQRGARNFVSYCLGCHALKYERWSRLGTDLRIPAQRLQQELAAPGDETTTHILTPTTASDDEEE